MEADSYAALRGYGLAKTEAALEEASPLSPWLWRTDWLRVARKSLTRERVVSGAAVFATSYAAIVPGWLSSSAQGESVISSAWFQFVWRDLIVKATRA